MTPPTPETAREPRTEAAEQAWSGWFLASGKPWWSQAGWEASKALHDVFIAGFAAGAGSGEAAGLREALRKYGTHLTSCANRTWTTPQPPCDCGLVVALSEVPAAPPAPAIEDRP